MIRAAIDEHGWHWASVQQLDANRGFGAANNAVIRVLLDSASPPDYFHLLNPDTIVRPGAVRALVQFLDDHPQVGIAGSQMISKDGDPQASAFRFPTILGELERGAQLGLLSKLLSRWVVARPVREPQAHPTDWVCGASMTVRRERSEERRVGKEGRSRWAPYE